MAQPTLNQGVRGSGIIGTEDRAVRDVSAAMAMLEPEAGPLTQMLQRLGAEKVDNPEYEWFEDELVPRFDALGASLTAGAATMTVVTFKMFRKYDLVKIANGEIVRVTATPSTTAVSIARAFGTTAAAAANQGDQLHIIGSAFPEGSGRRDIATTQAVKKTNYCQIHKTTWGVTRTNKDTKQYAGQDIEREKAKKLSEHKRDIESSIWHGELKKDSSTDTHPARATKGILAFITTNVKDAGGDLTEEEFEDWLRICFRYGSSEKVVFCSPKVIGVINGFSRGKLVTKSGEDTYGVTMTKYENAGRKVMLVENKQFSNDSPTDLSGIAGYAVCLDMADLKLKHMSESVVMYKPNVQANDIDGREDQYISDVGISLAQERKHGLLVGVTG